MAKVEFSDLRLSFIRNFPNAYIALENLEVTGIDDFEDELLVAFDRLSVTADILSIIRMQRIEVKSILLDRPRLNGRILEDGRANWEIFKVDDVSSTEEVAPVEITETDPFIFNVRLHRFEIRNMELSFRDDVNKIAAEVQLLNFILRGDMRKENVDLDLKLDIDGIDFWLDGIRLVNSANIGFTSVVAADLRNMGFVIKDNIFNLNDIVLKFDGSVDLQDDDINIDVVFATERTDFKSLLSLIPIVYMNDFKDLRTTGILSLNGDIKGTFNENIMPSANVNLLVENAMFSYPDLPKSVENINIAVRAFYDGVVFDRTTVDIDRFSFEMAGNPFSASLNLKTPESDLQIAAKFAGKIDIDSLADIIHLEDMVLNGLLECDISLAGRLSTLENEQFEDFQAKGFLKLSGFNFISSDFPQGIEITSTQLHFTPRFVELINFDAITGQTDISMNGRLENFIPFIFKDETIRGTLTLRSDKIDLNEIMSSLPEGEDSSSAEEPQLSIIEIPKNIDFTMNVNINNIIFDNLLITNTAGALIVRDGKVTMRNLGMNLLEGSMVLNGEYNTQNIKEPFIDFGMNIRQFDISSAISSFSMLESILPNPQNYIGRVSATLTLYSVLDEQLSPVLDSVNSRGQLQTHNLEIRNSPLFGTLANVTNNERWRNPAPGNINIGYEIRDGRLWIEEPIRMNLLPARIEIRGDQGLDMTLNYRIGATMPFSAIGSGATDILNRIPGGSNISEIQLAGFIRGNVRSPDISLSVADMASTITTAIRDQVTETVTHRVGEVRTQASEEINRQIEQIMAEAQRQADNIRNNVNQSADRLRREANVAADRLISEAAGRSVIERQVAQTAANRLRSEGETNAQRLEQEGENQANAVINAAQIRANDLRR
ncbi:MAG: hypothetical protein FWD87_08950 [Spirochaetaceae bacterium]|nr:hypothetical protein [Spirochaetaceae bacterium]